MLVREMTTTKKPKNYKFIAVSPETHSRLQELGKMNDTMDSVIQRLLPREQQVLKTWQCGTCGMFVSGRHRPVDFNCVECGSNNWLQGEDF